MACFLSIPPTIRRRIYVYAGIPDTGEQAVHLAPSRYALARCDSSEAWTRLRCIASLSLTCRTMYEQVSTMVYQDSRVIFAPKRGEDLQFLENLRPITIARLRNLTVILPDRVPSRLARHTGVSEAQYTCVDDSTGEEECASQILNLEDFFLAWAAMMKRFLNHVRPHQLNLYLICRVDSVRLATVAMQPLRSTRHLAHCSISLSQSRHSRFEVLAREVALGAEGKSIPEAKTFRYANLPAEIRYRILELTDLVTPQGVVAWSPTGGYTVRAEDRDGSRLRQSQHSTSEHNAFLSIESRDIQQRLTNRWQDEASTRHACFHHRFPAACTFECHRWASPFPLFLVCKTMRDDAGVVFSQNNHFIIHPDVPFTTRPAVNTNTFHAALFFKRILATRPTSLRYLRSFEVVFPPFGLDYCLPGSLVLRDWTDTLARVRQHVNLPLLTVRVSMANYTVEKCRVPAWQSEITKVQALNILATNVRILKPLGAWRHDLQRFHIHLNSPLYWTEAHARRCAKDPGFEARELAELEERIGALVMGDQSTRLNEGKLTRLNRVDSSDRRTTIPDNVG